MPTDQTSLSEKVSIYYSLLSRVASDLNAVSDELGKSIADIDSALKKLNLGISVWLKISGWDDADRGGSAFWSEEIGYAKISGKWGISLRRREGFFEHPDDESCEAWLFSDAPRNLRLEAIERIPGLLEKLSKEATTTTAKIQNRLSEVQTVAEAVKQAALQPVKRHPAAKEAVMQALGVTK